MTAKVLTELRWRAPALRISNVVCGRETFGTRVKYFVEPGSGSGEKAIPEQIVLKRWRRRKMDGQYFHGTRLSPTIWRAIDLCFNMTPADLAQLSVEQVTEAIALKHDALKSAYLKLPATPHLTQLFAALGAERLESVMQRHLSADRADRFGTPDLFLYSVCSATQMLSFFRLVEVKRPRERISVDQQEELDFLVSLGLPARVLRLIER